MFPESMANHLKTQLDKVRADGLFKEERVLASTQGTQAALTSGQKAINLCANNYLGLANDPTVVSAASVALKKWGYGLASVRFICGTQQIHKDLEKRLAGFLGMEDAILYGSCFDANGGLFETLLGEEDAVISDALNHASIIDGVRLCKAKRFRYRNGDLGDLRVQLEAAKDARFKLIATDGVFSMDGIVAPLKGICDLAEQFGAMVMVDDSHAVGVLGEKGGGTPEYCGVKGRVDILTGTLGKALGGASGGYTAARKEIVEWLRQRSRPYLFSNSLPPSVVGGSLAALDIAEKGGELRKRLRENSTFFRSGLEQSGFHITPGDHPIIPVLIGDSAKAKAMADALLQEGVYVIAFSFPVVPEGQARIRTQMSSAHTKPELETALEAFRKVGRKLEVIR